jgi:hypothetical protein
MEYCLRLGNGIGNKIFVLVYYLFKYPNDTIYVADQLSVHQKGTEEEKIWYLYPQLLNNPGIKFVSFKKYLELKEAGMPKLNEEFRIPLYNVEGFSKLSIRKYFKVRTDLDYLAKKYDLDTGLFVHFRLGDKFFINYESLQQGHPLNYVVMKPEFYLKYIKLFKGPVYIFSDSPEIAKCMFPGFNHAEEGVNETVYCFQNCKNAMISDSTMSIAALKLNNRRYNAIVPGYTIIRRNLQIAPFFESSARVTLELDKSLMLTKRKDYADIVNKCNANKSSLTELRELYKTIRDVNTEE